jgi:SAM-dependent methyltransferase
MLLYAEIKLLRGARLVEWRVVLRIFHKIRWSLEQRGLIRTMTSAAKSIGRRLARPKARAPHPFDVQYGVATDGVIPGHDLAIGHPNDRFIAGYAAVPPSRFRGAIEKWRASDPSYPIEEYTFIDFGCGKGRAVLLASEFAFREVVGVELNTSLANTAKANAARWMEAGSSRCSIRIVCGDALELKWPEGPCLAYLYNPFAQQVMLRLAESMKVRFSSCPNHLEILYQKPEQATAFEDGFEMVWCQAIPMSDEDKRAELVADPKDESRAFRLLMHKPLEAPHKLGLPAPGRMCAKS